MWDFSTEAEAEMDEKGRFRKAFLVASLFPVVGPGAPSSVLVPSSDALCS